MMLVELFGVSAPEDKPASLKWQSESGLMLFGDGNVGFMWKKP